MIECKRIHTGIFDRLGTSNLTFDFKIYKHHFINLAKLIYDLLLNKRQTAITVFVTYFLICCISILQIELFIVEKNFYKKILKQFLRGNRGAAHFLSNAHINVTVHFIPSKNIHLFSNSIRLVIERSWKNVLKFLHIQKGAFFDDHFA